MELSLVLAYFDSTGVGGSTGVGVGDSCCSRVNSQRHHTHSISFPNLTFSIISPLPHHFYIPRMTI